jgi:hypothetical protein
MATHDSIWILLPALSMQWVHAYIGHSDSSLVLYEIYIGICIRLELCLYFSCLLFYYVS